jgi:polyketide synthase 12
VRIAVRAAGLNFRDVLIAVGLYPDVAQVGSEAAGEILELAPQITDLAVGDRVMGLVPNAFGTVAISERRLLAKVPEGWSDAQAAAMPIAFLTASYGLLELGELKAGQRVLIHSAAGGVGIAAVQLAKRQGAEVFATAHPEKWQTLQALGLDRDHIASSRDDAFRQKFSEQTGGRGVELVLNSLAGELIDASLDLLVAGGRFIEMGKTDIRDAGGRGARRRPLRGLRPLAGGTRAHPADALRATRAVRQRSALSPAEPKL